MITLSFLISKRAYYDQVFFLRRFSKVFKFNPIFKQLSVMTSIYYLRNQDSRQIQGSRGNMGPVRIHDDSPGVSLRSLCVKESRAINYACPSSHVVRVPINNRWRRKVRGLCTLHRRSLQRQSITKINLPRNVHSGKSDPTHPSLLGTVGKFNDFVPLVLPHEFSACFRKTLLLLCTSIYYYINFS